MNDSVRDALDRTHAKLKALGYEFTQVTYRDGSWLRQYQGAHDSLTFTYTRTDKCNHAVSNAPSNATSINKGAEPKVPWRGPLPEGGQP